MCGEYINNNYGFKKIYNYIIIVNLLMYLLCNTKLDIHISLDMYAKPYTLTKE